MTKQELHAHLIAYADSYNGDAEYWRRLRRPDQALFMQGKAEAFAHAAAWLNEMEG